MIFHDLIDLLSLCEIVFDNRVKVSADQLILIILFIKGNVKRVIMLKLLRILSLHFNYGCFSHKNSLAEITENRLKLNLWWIFKWYILKNGNFVVLANEFSKKVKKPGLDADIFDEDIFNFRNPSISVQILILRLYLFKRIFQFFSSFNDRFRRIYSWKTL